MDDADPLAVVEKYKESLPEHFQVVNTVIYKYGWNEMLALGYIDINNRTRSFTVVNMNPVGLKLFELSGNEEGVNTNFMMEGLEKKGMFANAIGEDIRRIYFDLNPLPGAEVKKKTSRIVFRQQYGEGLLVYIFAGDEGYLVEKKYYEDNKLKWRVSYYEYRQKNGKIYPGGIVMNNYIYGYTLTVRLKEIKN